MNGLRTESLEVRASSRLQDLEPTRQRVLDFLSGFEVDKRTLYVLELVLEETFMNVVSHAFADGLAHPFEIGLKVNDSQIELHLRDTGAAFNPLQQPTVALPTSLDEARVGGLGLHLVRNYASSMHYEHVAGVNHLVVTIARHGA